MRIESELQEIKARLDRIESFIIGLMPTDLNTSTEPDYEILNFEVRQAQVIGAQDYSYKLTVRNNNSENLRLSGWVLFLDSDGFEVVRDPIDFFTVAGYQTHTESGLARLTDPSVIYRVADVTASLEAY